MRILTFFILSFLFLISCTPLIKKEEPIDDHKIDDHTKVKLETTIGEITLRLYDETPLHRDNFIKIIEEGVLDSVLFHRVINNFMVQSGDPDSKYAASKDTLGEGGLGYRVPAEFSKELFHKKGSLAAARDNNSERASSSTQFYLVQGKVFNDSLLDKAQERINQWLAQYYVKHDSLYKEDLRMLNEAEKSEDMETYIALNKKFNKLAKDYKNFDSYTIPKAHREVYKTLGGTPHLDQNYTVFGEVISGLEVVDSIASVKTNELDRPLKDVRILRVEILN